MQEDIEAEMWRRWHAAKDEQARTWLITHWTSKARSVAYRWPGVPRDDREDVAQEAVLALIRCVDTWDAALTPSFSQFLVFRCRAAVCDFLRRKGFAKRNTRVHARRIDAAEEAVLVRNAGRPATDEEVAEELGLDIDELHRLRSEAHSTHWNVFSLDVPMGLESGDGDLHLDRVADPATSVERAVEDRNRYEVLRSVLDRLPARHREILEERYLKGAKMQDIATRWGVHPSRASQIETEALIMAHRLSFERPLPIPEETPCG